MEFVKSNKNKNLLLYGGFLHREDRKQNNTIYWRCVESSCKGRIITINGEIKSQPKENSHNHVPDPCKIQCKMAVNKIKEAAVHTQNTPHDIISTVQIVPGVAGAIPSVHHLKHTIRRVRTRNQCAPPIPKTVSDLKIADEYTKTIKGEQFLIFDSGASQDRILIFSTENNLKLMDQSTNWLVDGTFKTVPSLFYQLFTIHVLIQQGDQTVSPTIYALLTDKSQSTYTRFLKYLLEIKPSLNPTSVIMDFEHASINAFKIVFPHAEQQGCFFHFSKCMWRQIQNVGLVENYINNANFALHIRMLAALAYVPPDNVINAYEEILETQFYVENEDLVMPFLDYFEDNWVGKITGRRKTRRQPRHPIDIWNCHYSAKNGLPTTNNAVEGWHRGFTSVIGSYYFINN